MSTLPDESEQRLNRLLALKRYEVPPPYFFDHLPRRVLVSIRSGAQIDERSWWRRLLRIISQEPMVAGSYAALGVGALLFGVSVFQMAIDPEAAGPGEMEGMVSTAGSSPLIPSHLPGGVIYHVTPGTLSFVEVSPTPPMRPAIPSRFDESGVMATPVSYFK